MRPDPEEVEVLLTRIRHRGLRQIRRALKLAQKGKVAKAIDLVGTAGSRLMHLANDCAEWEDPETEEAQDVAGA